MRLDLDREAVLPEAEALDHAARKRLPVHVGIGGEVRVEVADGAVHLRGQHDAVDLLLLAAEARRDDGELLAERGGRGGLTVRVGEHGHGRERVRHLGDLVRHLVLRRAERLQSVAQHEGVGHVVDVLARAAEVHELAARRERRARDLLLDEVLHGLHVVVRRLLNVLHALRVGHGEAVRDPRERGRLVRRERRALRQAGVGAERREPRALHGNAPLHEAVLGKDLAQLVDLRTVAAVQRGHRAQHVYHRHS